VPVPSQRFGPVEGFVRTVNEAFKAIPGSVAAYTRFKKIIFKKSVKRLSF
jgi:hypothetical protein